MLKIDNPQVATAEIVRFITQTFKKQGKTKVVIAVSGGIDSALSLSLLAQALGPANITVLLLPYGDQSTALAQKIAVFNQIPAIQVVTIDIKPLVDIAATSLLVTESSQLRLGNLKARMRMMCVYDTAKKLEALVCGTENKSEQYLGYFTRFGDAAADLEPLGHLYKTQVRQIASYLKLPPEIIEQAPSAGLWPGQTDEVEMGFTYQQADEVLEHVIDQKIPRSELALSVGGSETVTKILAQLDSMSFKLQVPYQFSKE